MRWLSVSLSLCLLAAGAAWGTADEVDEANVIRQRIESYVAAYNDQQAAAVADHWSDDAVYVNRDTGERITGRPAIAAMFQKLFQSGEAAQLNVTVEAIRRITPEVAIEDGTAEMVSADGEPLHSTYTAVHVKRDGQWYLDSVRETDAPAPPPAASNELEQLSWMVGEWLDKAEDATVRSQWQWAKNKTFLTSTFNVSVEDRVELEGTQIIGWDPAAGQIRSWVFDSEGGFGEGVWRRAGNQWIVETVSTLSDGSQGSATNVYTLVDDGTFLWKSVDRQVDGEPQPDIDELPVYRQ
jgi:uncharacterized protein (TIGR02246 family)